MRIPGETDTSGRTHCGEDGRTHGGEDGRTHGGGRWYERPAGVLQTGRGALPVWHLRLLLLLLVLLGSPSCKQSYTPKPSGYLRVDYPEKSYHLYSDQEFFEFEIPDYSVVEIDSGPAGEEGWLNVAIPELNGKIYLSYKPVGENLNAYITDCRELVYKHTVKAQEIEETPFVERENKRFGMVYDLKGDVASAVQFFITDSTTHFLRGSLYFNIRPNRDSLNPVIEFLREDIIHLIETTEWKY